MVSIIRAWSSGSRASPESTCALARSRISRAVTELPRASLGSETWNMLAMKSATRREASASRSARSRSAETRRTWTASPAVNAGSSRAAAPATATPKRCRFTYRRSWYAALGGRACTGSLRRWRPTSAASSAGEP